jgi:hypothetical protein
VRSFPDESRIRRVVHISDDSVALERKCSFSILGYSESKTFSCAGLELRRWARLFVSVTMRGNTRSPFDSPLSALGVRSGQALDFARDDRVGSSEALRSKSPP